MSLNWKQLLPEVARPSNYLIAAVGIGVIAVGGLAARAFQDTQSQNGWIPGTTASVRRQGVYSVPGTAPVGIPLGAPGPATIPGTATLEGARGTAPVRGFATWPVQSTANTAQWFQQSHNFFQPGPTAASEAYKKAEKQVAELVKQLAELNQASPINQRAVDEAQAQLTELLNQQFQMRHDDQQARLDKIVADAEQARAALDSRLANKEQIVERRAKQLLGQRDPLNWDYNPTPAGQASPGIPLTPIPAGLLPRAPTTTGYNPPLASSFAQPKPVDFYESALPKRRALEEAAVSQQLREDVALQMPQGDWGPSSALIDKAHAAVLAKQELEDLKRLVDRGAMSAGELRRASSNASKAEAQLELEKNRLLANMNAIENLSQYLDEQIDLKTKTQHSYTEDHPGRVRATAEVSQLNRTKSLYRMQISAINEQLNWLEDFVSSNTDQDKSAEALNSQPAAETDSDE